MEVGNDGRVGEQFGRCGMVEDMVLLVVEVVVVVLGE